MLTDGEEVRAQAVEWHLRRRDMAVADWPRFIAWLEADSTHAAAYDDIALQDSAFLSVVPANDIEPLPPRRRGGWRWSALAATVAVVAGAGIWTVGRPAPPQNASYVIATAPGVQRSVQLADGSTAELGGGTRLILDRGDPRFVGLESGAAVFHVSHDAAHPFRLQTGDHVLQDAGTVFEVVRSAARLDVTVAEGSVIFDPEGRDVALSPGKRLSVDGATDRVAVETLPAGRVGEWRDGRLAFTNESLGYVVARLSRVTGARVSLAPSLSGQRFTGMVRLTGSAARDIPHFAELTGTGSTQVGDNWVIGPPRGR